MTKARRDITGMELEDLHARLDRMLDRLGVETQPKVAQRLLALSQNQDAQIRDYLNVVKVDWALTGRILRLANSAFYAQRQPVTKLDRALVLLGIERTKAISLGFYLSRAAAGGGARELSRKVWGQSVYRASLCSSLARSHCPHLASEAFIVGLMLDCGIPLMARMIGEGYVTLFEQTPSPAKLMAAEHETLEFTHVDVAATLMKRWKMPTLLSRPIAWHHAQPPAGKTHDPSVLLQRIAYYVGAVQLDGACNTPEQKTPLPTIADRLFDFGSGELERAVRSANQEYIGTASLFDEVGQRLADVDAVADQVQTQLVEIMDEQMARSVAVDSRGGPEQLTISGQMVEVEPGRGGEVVAYLNGSDGERLLSCTVDPTKETPDSVRQMLGLEEASSGEMLELMRVMQSMAA